VAPARPAAATTTTPGEPAETPGNLAELNPGPPSTAKVFAGSANVSDNSPNHHREPGLIVNDSGLLGGVQTTITKEVAGGTPSTG